MTPRRKGCLITSLLMVLMVVALGRFASTVLSGRVDFKSNTPYENQRILALDLRRTAPEAQMEDDTCGLHTLRAIYKAYGMDPDKENLRTRLGLDVPANPSDPESTGTLQFDMVRVLLQNGFDYTFLDPTSGADLITSLAGTNMAALLIRRRENGGLHWVAAAPGSGGTVQIIDSLVPEPYPESAAALARDCLLSGVLVCGSTRTNTPAEMMDEAHYAAVMEMMRMVGRYRDLSKSRKVSKGREAADDPLRGSPAPQP